jgi:hypothetical protein
MRFHLGGLLISVLASAACGQVRGFVESIGFGNGMYRPECWTPMIVNLTSQIDEPVEYRIEVHQHDLDFDHVIYVKQGITLNGHATQRWEVCFLPEPIHGGLPDGSISELQDRLRVYLTNKEGTRQILQLPITTTLRSLETPRSLGPFDAVRGNKLVLWVQDGESRATLNEVSYDRAEGIVEIPRPAPVRPAGLPQSVLAYEAVDAVVWVSGDARQLSEQGSTQLAALQQWVREGGMLIVCQPMVNADRVKIEPFADMLPIRWSDQGRPLVEVRERQSLKPLLKFAGKRRSLVLPPAQRKKRFPFAHAQARPEAIVEPNATISWDKDETDVTPYIARIPYGLGSVTWVAQDLGDPSLASAIRDGWPYVWDQVFGWKADTILPDDINERNKDRYALRSSSDIGSAMEQGVQFGAKGAGLIGLAMLFFIVYWLVAGPGSFMFLANRKRKELSWPVFALSALVATALTVLLVRVVLRGSPEIKHATVVRIDRSPDAQPAVALSKIGLYIPRDGEQRVALTDLAGPSPSYLSPLAIPPASGDSDFPATLDYQVPIHDQSTGASVEITVPFRSTLKKLQAKRCGPIAKEIAARSLRLHSNNIEKNPIAGLLDNNTGLDLRNVYVAFRSGSFTFVLYLPYWSSASGKDRIDLAEVYPKADELPMQVENIPDPSKTWRGDIENRWSYIWLRSISQRELVEDLDERIPTSIPVASFFDLIPPSQNETDPNGTFTAFALHRRGARGLNISPAIASGQLVVVAQSAEKQPLPYPLEVNGYPVGGDGSLIFQFAFPLDHAGMFSIVPATTQPVTNASATTEPATTQPEAE